MFKFQVFEKRRVYGDPVPHGEPAPPVVEEWVLTHEVSVPDKETLGLIMHTTGDQLAPKNTNYRS
jgi:hypothetical protein